MEIIYVSLLTIKLLSHCCLHSYVNVPMGNYLYKEGAPVRQCVLCDVRDKASTWIEFHHSFHSCRTFYKAPVFVFLPEFSRFNERDHYDAMITVQIRPLAHKLELQDQQ